MRSSKKFGIGDLKATITFITISTISISCAGDFKKSKDKTSGEDVTQEKTNNAIGNSGDSGAGDNESAGKDGTVSDGSGSTPSTRSGSAASGSSGSSSGSSSDASGGSSGSNAGTTPTLPKLGINDSWVETIESKSWNNNSTEPQLWASRTRETKEVLRIFDDAQFCKYQIKTSSDNLRIPNNITAINVSDQYCKAQAAGACTESLKCTDEKIAALGAGNYAGSPGIKRICIAVACSGTGTQSISRKESQIWTNSAVAVPENIVRRADYECKMQLRRGDVATNYGNPCDLTRQRSVSFSRSLRTLESHKINGQVNQLSTSGAKSAVTAIGSVAQGSVKELPASCSTSGRSGLKVNFQRTFCNGTSLSTETFDSGKIDLSSSSQGQYLITSDQSTLSYDFAGVTDLNTPICPANYKRNYRMPQKTACIVQLTASENDGVILGKGYCNDAFSWYNGSTKLTEKVQFKEFSFTCNAPKDFDYGILGGR
jgi:hypothetical protein